MPIADTVVFNVNKSLTNILNKKKSYLEKDNIIRKLNIQNDKLEIQ
jgi:hypothetical protein